jgi:hypothetical protein
MYSLYLIFFQEFFHDKKIPEGEESTGQDFFFFTEAIAAR